MLQQNISLKDYSNFKIGGPAKYFFEFKTKDELLGALTEWKEINQGLGNYFILGGGTNVLFRDEGYDGLVLKDSLKLNEAEGNLIDVGSGNLLEELLGSAISNSFSNLEWAGGLPGTVGGAIRGNAGAFGGETKDNVVSVESLVPQTLEVKERTNIECGFSYRNSIFKSGEGKGEIILSAKFSFKKGDKYEIERLTQEKADYRSNRHPLEYPNVGSIFKNIPWEEVPDNFKKEFEQYIKQDPFPVLPTAKLLSILNLKGLTVGGAMVSEKHPNFIVNKGDATSKDVRELIEKIKELIRNNYSISLEEEVYCL